MRVATVLHALRVALAAALVGLALTAVAPSRAGAADLPCRHTFSSGALARGIPDNGSVGVGIDVPEDGLVVSDVDVALDVQHPRARELVIFLTSATDTGAERSTTRLFNHEDGGTLGEALTPPAGLVDTVFDDSAEVPISWGTSPFTGRFLPSKPLSPGNGVTGGTYQLTIFDGAVDNVGVLDDWSVTLTYRSCDFDADGVEDHRDQCRGITARTATGCPVTSRSLSASYRSGKFRGALSSPVAGCKAGRQVSVFKVRRGADARVGTATTRADGSWRLAKAKRSGRYYATSARAVVPDRAECPAVRSASFRVR